MPRRIKKKNVINKKNWFQTEQIKHLRDENENKNIPYSTVQINSNETESTQDKV